MMSSTKSGERHENGRARRKSTNEEENRYLQSASQVSLELRAPIVNGLFFRDMTSKSMYTFFYKNLVYKNIKASIGPKIKNILGTYHGLKF